MIVAVVTSGIERWTRCWIRAWQSSGNAEKVMVWFGMAAEECDRSPEDRVLGWHKDTLRAMDRLGERFDMAGALARSARAFPLASYRKRGWSSKVAAIRHVGGIFRKELIRAGQDGVLIWADHDLEIRGELWPLVDKWRATGKPCAAPWYSSFGTRMYTGERLGQHGVMVFDGRHVVGIAERWWAWMAQHGEPNDEIGFVKAFGGMDGARAVCGDLYAPELYASCDCYQVRRQTKGAEGIIAATLELAGDNRPLVRHWCAKWGKRQFEQIWPWKAEDGEETKGGE